MTPGRALPDALLPAHRALARRVAEHSTLVAVLAAHDPSRSALQGRSGTGGWEVICSCAVRIPLLPGTGPATWQHTHAAHVASALAANAEEVMAELARLAWPDDPSPMEEAAHASGVTDGRAVMLDEVMAALPPGGPFLADLLHAPAPKGPTS